MEETWARLVLQHVVTYAGDTSHTFDLEVKNTKKKLFVIIVGDFYAILFQKSNTYVNLKVIGGSNIFFNK